MDNASVIVEWMKAGNVGIPSILLKSYTKIGLSDSEFVCLLQIYESMERGNKFPTPGEVASSLGRSTNETSSLFRSLVHKKVLKVEEFQESGESIRSFSFAPLWVKLAESMQVTSHTFETENNQVNLYTLFEREFGRPLSPFECESLSMWVEQDKHSDELVENALREAVISRKLNFRYIDRILFNWKQNGVQTVEEAKEYSQQFRGYQKPQPQGQEDDKQTEKQTIPFYNWLEG